MESRELKVLLNFAYVLFIFMVLDKQIVVHYGKPEDKYAFICHVSSLFNPEELALKVLGL